MEIVISYVTNTTLKSNTRVITSKVFGNMPYDAMEFAPYGWDSNPVSGVMAAYLETSNNSKQAIVGYNNKNQKALTGESRIYSTDSEGSEQSRIWLHDNGDVEIGGTGDANTNTKHLTRFEDLQTALTNYLALLNGAINTSITALGGAYTPPTAINISSSKTDKLKIQ